MKEPLKITTASDPIQDRFYTIYSIILILSKEFRSCK